MADITAWHGKTFNEHIKWRDIVSCPLAFMDRLQTRAIRTTRTIDPYALSTIRAIRRSSVLYEVTFLSALQVFSF
jgi:hypothetical protein